ncbi:TonB-dependent receptor plug domain-containing protein [Pedobacter sp. LMG 31464]|uniref:TonB-dependent receptor plug domain-containing protein n=1 Tax=Pedobacter planticolens TaxID=2679964 RepID=A0A923E0Q0_9SPHI|nr:TonB-dependent receptor plug domain-containing protein [Pedobacter planticolens]MBB2146576.1 TonB-dependent receptor plug domain-containing protein [Pedobacter planticolens]
MKRKLLILSIALLSVFSFSAFITDDDPFTELLKKLEEFAKKYPQEKVYLHLDKPYYAVGDNIWFKAYVVDSRTSEPSTLSKILYVELINEKDSIKRQIKLPMQSGITWGDFKLTDSLNEGNYRIRAYTQWMRNAGPEFFFDKTIKIGNSWANKVFTKTNNQYSTENNAEKVNSTIQFSDKNGKPYANNLVNYEVQLNSRNITRGKATTNENGEINVAILNTQPNVYKSGKITATITMADKQTVVKVIPVKTTSAEVDVQFFPEGGNLVEGLPSKVAIKAINANGLGENVSGRVLDNEGSEILKFETAYLGMGSFILNPLPGKTYTAKVKLTNGSEKTIALPKPQASGYVLSVNNTDSAKMNIKVILTTDVMNKGELKLVAQHNGNVYFVTKLSSEKQLISVSAPKSEFPSGIVQLTLFSADNLPVAERLAFVNNSNDKIALNVQNLKSDYDKRGNVDLIFTATSNAKPIEGSFSVAITNTAAVAPDLENESNILTSLLLTSDLKGYVEKPNHYFLNNDLKTRTQLDNLLLTQGWRRINWNNIINNQFSAIAYQAEKSLKISGTLTKGGKPVVKGKVVLFSNSNGFFVVDTLSDANGRFNFDKIDFTENIKFVVQARTDKNNKNIQIDLDVVPGQVVTVNKNTGDVEVNVNETLMPYLAQSDKYFDEQTKRGLLDRTITLKTVNIVEKKNPAPNSSNLNGAGRADFVVTAKDLETAFSLSMYLQGRVAGIMIRDGKAYSTRANGGAMSIVLDGMNMGSDFQLDDIIVQDIESVEVLKSIGNTAIYGSGGASGVIVITTKRGAGTESNYARYAPGIVTYAPKGYYQVRQFYSPKYDATPDPKPDLRSTVYWNPHVVSDATGKANLNYYNTDQTGTYRIVIEGIDVDGNLARKVITYQVN